VRLICPSCGAMASADAWIQDQSIRRCMALVAGLPGPVARHAVAYLGLFRPLPDAAGKAPPLRWAKALRLVEELAGQVSEPYVSWDRKPARPSTPRHWGLALETVLERAARGGLKRPLANHNYLRAVVYEVADQADLAGENARNAAILRGDPPQSAQGPAGDGSETAARTDEEVASAKENFRRLEEILSRVGKRMEG